MEVSDALEPTPGRPARAWHAVPVRQALAELRTGDDGLAAEEAARRLRRFGRNELPSAARPSLLVIFLRQFRDPLIYILLIAAVVSLAIGKVSDAGFIFAVLLINATIGTVQEARAEAGAEALQKMVRIRAVVMRDGERCAIDATELVPGDLVLVESGMAVPADIRLTGANRLRADESLLTGESLPVEKRADAVLSDETTLGDRVNLLHAGSSVLDGRGRGVVCRTGRDTELGRIAASVAETATAPPLVLRLRRFTRQIAVAVLGAVLILAALQLAQGTPPIEIFFLAIALAVAAIPEGLPVAITIALAVATNRMAKRNVIVRLLPAVEGLGACRLIASDKTGTLTVNRLTIVRLWLPEIGRIDVEGEGFATRGRVLHEGRPAEGPVLDRIRRLAAAGALCNEAELTLGDGEPQHTGDIVDVAFLVLAAKIGTDHHVLRRECPEIGAVPFESERRFAAAYNRCGPGVAVHVKGAAETILPMCGGPDLGAAREASEALAGEGYRVLALAAGTVSEEDARTADSGRLGNLELLGLAGLIDPVRHDVPDAVRACRAAGVEVRMITGDHPATGLAIARQLGIAQEDEAVMTGYEIGRAGDGIVDRIRRAHVFARIEPAQKTEIVRALGRAGHFVAVTGDGVNDAPALRAANIGVAMGRSGTDVARQAADLILTDDNFASIVGGIEEGRVAYDNVRKVTWLLIATAVAEILLFFLAQLTGLPLPLTPVQLLWLNLVTNGLQDVALAFEKGEPGVLRRRPRPPDEPIFDTTMIEQCLVTGIFMGLIGFGVFWYLLDPGWTEAEARNGLLLLMVLLMNVQVLNCRSETRSLFQVPLSANRLVVAAVFGAQALHIAAMHVPGLRDVLGVRPVAFETWLVLLGLAVTLIALNESNKAWRRGHDRRLCHTEAA